MQQLTGLDEMFLSLDTGRTTGHVAGIARFDARAEPRDELAWVRGRVADRLAHLPLLRWVLHPAPLGVDQRMWVEADQVDLDSHVRGVTLPAPGTDEQLHAFLDELMATLLERDRPMWQLHVVEGFADGGFAYVLKITHGLADGSAMWAVFDQLSDHPVELIGQVAPRRPRGGRAELVARGAWSAATAPVRAARLGGELATWARQRVDQERLAAVPNALARLLPGELSRPAAALANRVRPTDETEIASLFPSLVPPRSPFNGTVTSNQGIVTVDFALADLRRVGALVGGTINDALLAVTAGAARAYCATHGGIPERPLIVSAPVSWRTGDEPERWANQIWMLFLPLPTHLADPLERLREARRAAQVGKANWDRVPGHLLRRASAFLPSLVLAPTMKVLSRVPGHLTPKLYNIALSNVRGPRERPLYDGAPMRGYTIFGFLPPGIGLLLGGQSLGDRIVMSATVCRDIVTDYADLPRLLEQSLEELLALA